MFGKVGNYGYAAFQQAHQNMLQISLHVESIPENLQYALSILMEAPEEIETVSEGKGKSSIF